MKDTLSGSILLSASQRIGGFSRYIFQLLPYFIYFVPLFLVM
jgi:hypothetical protein